MKNSSNKFKEAIVFALACFFVTTSLFAQAPEKINYQAVVRDAGNELLSNQALGMQISILQGSSGGTAVYSETQNPTTNANGLVTIEIGSGSVVIGVFSTIDWSNGPYFVKTEIDPTGGTTYNIIGTNELLSVPFALYAKNSGSSAVGPPGPQGDPGADGKTVLNGIVDPTSEGVDGDFYLNTATSTMFGPKSGTDWGTGVVLIGPAGADGNDGADGAAGAAGTDGKTVLNGIVDPTSEGVDGDFYLNTATSTMFGPKSGTDWGTGVVLIGPAGADGNDGADGLAGVDGKTVLNGTIDPTAGDGADGDFYIDTDDNLIYGPKTAGVWGTGVVLIGAAGADGTDGTDGTDGLAGADGTDGKTVLNGTIDPTAGDGADGDFYIDTDDNLIYGPKTAGVWGTGISLVGAAGADGTNGTDGLAGTDGKTVLNGTIDPTSEGVDGDFYLNTATSTMFGPKSGTDWGTGVVLIGPAGADGTDGTDGTDGLAGADGTDGKTVLNGTIDPTAGDGADGDFYIDTDDNLIYGPKTAGVWGTGISLVGAAGADGTDGTDGLAGVDGTDGKTVLNGIVDPTAGDGADGDFYIDTDDNLIYGPKTAGVWGTGISLVGAAGADGNDGADGLAGVDGKTVLNGTIDPTAGDGADGDFYIDTDDNLIYGPKTAGVWGTGISLVGAAGADGNDGADGTDGKTVLNGIVDPTAGDGADGDFYIDTDDNLIYGPKTAGVWGTGISLVGAAGADGNDGADGLAGVDGKTVLNGTIDPTAGDGADGDFYIDTDDNLIYGPKTAGVWGTGISLVGAAGADGTDGLAGADGTDGKTVLNGTIDPTAGDGADGDFYIDTDDNLIYGPKTAGVWGTGISLLGAAGADGTDGTDGLAGADGTDGKTVLNGTIDPTAGDGADGDFYIDTDDNLIYGPKTAGVWGTGISLVGAAGADGTDGTDGLAGADGTDGKTVLNGIVDPTAGDGADGDFYIDTDDNLIYGPKTAGVWGTGISLVGAAGADGTDGTDGLAGAAGTDGKTVLNGIVDPTSEGVDGDFYLNTATSTMFGPKSGTDWGTGVVLIGPAGADGNDGADGLAGVDGKTVLNGTIDPTAGDGADGDFYIDTDDNLIYGPKTAGVWGTGISLVGAAGADGTDGTDGLAGADGTDGKTVLNGTIDPTAGDGADGDFYIDTDDNLIYGPKTAGVWGTGISLLGAAGADGTDGTDGLAGADGTDGKTVLNGTIDPTAGDGADGDFYIDTDDNLIYGPKTAGVWGTGISLLGAAGADGTDGTDGLAGADGTDGKTVLNGTIDPTAGDGADGDFYIDTDDNLIYGPKTAGVWGTGISLVGAAGADGTDGTDGLAGADGTDGKTVLNGIVDPTAGDGADGDFYIDTDDNLIYGPKTAGVWGTGISLVGAAGADGTDGTDGLAGADGTDGKTVLNGIVDPTAGDGADGDFYIDTDDNLIYGPKTAGVWGTGVVLIGPAGADGNDGADGAAGAAGTDGKTVLNGIVDPTSEGVDGDFYIDTDDNLIYGPKTAGVWGTGVSLVGAAGADGNDGADGAAGAAGTDGKTVLNGIVDPTSEGVDGDFYLNTATSTMFGPKSGTDWGTGVVLIGPAGADGNDGADGLAGVDGKTVLNGTIDPTAGDGADGDFYIDTDDNLIYGPKTAGVWGTGISLLGAAGADGTDGTDGLAGADGTDGKTVLNGTIDPTAGDGADGDFYIDTDDNLIYGPKTAGVWGTGVVLIGPAGADGNDGADGAAGADGTDGKTVLNGTIDPTAGDGADGDFYIDTDDNLIYGPKTAGVWGTGISLVGPAGADGNDGADGLAGVDGTDGKTVLNGIVDPTAGDGADGDFYIDTDDNLIYGPKTAGVWGTGISLVGAAGADGNDGADGLAGVDGKTVLNGTIDPTAGDGADGDFYIDTDDNLIYGPKTAGVWGTGISLVGAAGADGTDGLAGADGTDGKTVLNGTIDPTAGDGADGDFYIDTDDNLIYGPKTAGVWGTGISLVGAAGADGTDGTDGLAGVDGKTVLSGAIDPTSEGVDGDFYLNTATSTMFGPKSGGAWGVGISLVGPQGAQGDPGPAGADGTQLTAGNGLTKSVDVIDVGGSATIIANADNLEVNSSGTANQILLSSGTSGTPATFGALPLGNTDAVSGILSVTNGGTGSSVLTSGNFLQGNGTAPLTAIKTVPSGDVVGTSDAQIFTNKTIDADSNTITNIDNADIKAAAAIDATKIADGSVTNTEFQQLNGVTSTIVGMSDTQTLTNKTFTDNSTFIQDNLDNTKKVQLELSGITTATTRTLTVPDVNTTLVGTDATQVLTNKTISSADNTITISTSDITSGTFPDARIAQSSVTQHESALDHQNLSGAGTNTHAQIDSHIGNNSQHRVINDSGTSTTVLWSADKIVSELTTKSSTVHEHASSEITSGTFADARIAQSSVTQHQSAINHDALAGFVANEHLDWSINQGSNDIHQFNITAASITQHVNAINHNSLSGVVTNEHRDHSDIFITGGVGLSGGGNITDSRAIDLNIGGLTIDNSPNAGSDYIAFWDASQNDHKRVSLDNLPSSAGPWTVSGDNIYWNNTGDVGIGTTNFTGSWKLRVDGSIRAKEIKVETGWSDFVFFNDYDLPTLEEVETHINEKGHLKDIPSAKEVEENGIFLGEMDSKLLQKIEELTLYSIEQNKRLKEQSIKIQLLEQQVAKANKTEKENELLKSLLVRVTKVEEQLKSKN